MKLEIDDPQRNFVSGSQTARAWTEGWVAQWMYCPNCGNSQINQFRANLPVADFFCPSCQEQYELKSQKKAFGAKVLDGAFEAKQQRLASSTNPSLLLLNYDVPNRTVTNACVVPKHFFVPEVIERRKPLAPTARRAGWVGSHILLNRIPETGKIYFVRGGQVVPKEAVLEKWRQTLFLRELDAAPRGWLIEVMNCVEAIGANEFTLDDVYAFENELSAIYPQNQNVKPKIRQQLQFLRDRGYLDFVSRGHYRLRRFE